MDNEVQQIAIPLNMNVDIQLGPDGHPWLRYQISAGAMTVSFVIPIEHAETFISKISEGTRMMAKKAVAKQADIVVPDFTGIAIANKNGQVESYEN